MLATTLMVNVWPFIVKRRLITTLYDSNFSFLKKCFIMYKVILDTRFTWDTNSSNVSLLQLFDNFHVTERQNLPISFHNTCVTTSESCHCSGQDCLPFGWSQWKNFKVSTNFQVQQPLYLLTMVRHKILFEILIILKS